MQLWSSHSYFQEELRKLDPQPGECFALFRAKDKLRAIILIEKPVPGWPIYRFMKSVHNYPQG